MPKFSQKNICELAAQELIEPRWTFHCISLYVDRGGYLVNLTVSFVLLQVATVDSSKRIIEVHKVKHTASG